MSEDIETIRGALIRWHQALSIVGLEQESAPALVALARLEIELEDARNEWPPGFMPLYETDLPEV